MKVVELLLEHYVNLITPEEKEKYVDQVWDLLQDAYKEIGGFKSVTSKEDLIHGTYLWKLVRREGKIVTVMIYKNQHGRKMIGLATDQSRQGKIDLAKIAQDDHQLIQNRFLKTET